MSEKPLSETQELAVAVVKKAIVNPEAELLLAPISGTRYIHFDDVFIVIDSHHVSINNGSYSYHIDMDTTPIDKLRKKFNTKLESTRKTWEHVIVKKTNKSLANILNELTNK
jgi:hypothetical protein